MQCNRDVSSNVTRIEEAERCIHKAEITLGKTEVELDSATKRIPYLESKTDDLESRDRRKNADSHSSTSSTASYRDG